MTSRSSSWVNLTENNKRRIWQWFVAILLLVILNSVLLLLMLMSMDEDVYVINYGTRAMDMMRSDAARYCSEMIGTGAFRTVVTTFLAVLLAFGGYSYINDKVKLDFYESMPMKRGDRFSTIWLSGVLIYTGTYIIGTLICFFIMTVTGYGDVYTMEEALYAFVKLLLYFLAVYHLYIFAMMLTGTAIGGLCAYLVMSLFELATRGLIGLYKISFFKYDYILDDFYIPVISPYGLFMKMTRDSYVSGGRSPLEYALYLLLLVFVLLAASYIVYMKRPVERAGKTLVFKGMATFLKLLMATEVVAYASLLTLYVLNRTRQLKRGDICAIILVCFITSLIICSIIEAVFELDIKAVVNKKAHWFICAGFALAVFFGFKIDFFNIDEYVPAADKVASVVFAPQGYEDSYGYFVPEYGNVRDYEYWLNNMNISDVDSVRSLAALSMRKYDEALKVVGSEEEIYRYGDGEEFSSAVVMYRMKNGRLITRQIYIPVKDSEAVALLDTIMTSDEFVNGFFAEMNPDIDKCIPEKKDIYSGGNVFTDGIHIIKLDVNEIKEFISCYRSDMETYSYRDRLNMWPVGYLDYEIAYNDPDGGGVRASYGSTRSIVIYPDMNRCMSFLKDRGYEPGNFDLSKEAVRISVKNYHYDKQEEYAKEQGLDYLPEDMAEDFIKSRLYDATSDSEKFNEIASCIVPNERGHWRWDGGLSADYDYDVYVIFDPSSPLGTQFRNGACYCFLKDMVPGVVEKELSL